MKESDKKVEQFIEKIMKETSLETPTFDFTSKIMAQVEVLEQSKIKEYKPLISKSGWVAIFGSLLALVGYASFGNLENTKIELDFGAKISSLMPNIHLSDTISYSVLIVALMVLIQIPILKNYFDKRFEV